MAKKKKHSKLIPLFWLLLLISLAVIATRPAHATTLVTPCAQGFSAGNCSTSSIDIVSASAEASHVLSLTPKNVVRVSATNHTATAGYLVLINATSAPVDGAFAASTVLACAALPASGTVTIDRVLNPQQFSVGITAVLTSAASCFTKTTGVITGFIDGVVR